MSKDKHIDNISEKVWKAYFSGVILTSDKERVDEFISQYPEFEEEFRSMSKDDIAAVNRITKRVNKKIHESGSNKKSPVLWWGAAVAVVLIITFIFNVNNSTVEETIADHSLIHNAVKDTASTQTIDSVDVIAKESTMDDTLFFFERKGDDIKVEELIVEVKDVIYPEYVAPVVEPDTGFVLDKQDEKILIQKEVYKKSFATSVDYRQTVHVEDNFYSQSKTMGKTTSYASPIKGYSYEIEGMPNFKGSDEELLSYINEKLSSDELLSGIRRKMKASLSFVVTNKGKIKDVLVQNCNHKQFGMSLMQIMENMPDWNPSEFKGKKGKAHYVLKIVFQ